MYIQVDLNRYSSNIHGDFCSIGHWPIMEWKIKHAQQ